MHNLAVTTTDSLVVIAGNSLPLERALATLRAYSKRTLRKYDLPGPGDAGILTAEEIRRTRAVSSRISEAELEWFLDRASTAPWLPAHTDLADADPDAAAGVYDAMTDLFDHFLTAAPRGVLRAKISKVLHVKQPALYPIIDSHLEKTYRDAGRAAALRHPQRGFTSMSWAAIRADLLENRNSGALAAVRDNLQQSTDLADFNQVTDLRLLDMLTW
ncbi:hypothetical protein Br6_04927 [Rhodococcus sp. Br-6]|nr:hypothetical protein Br6_04927 [Rhodococcus sp. Br-6]